MEIVGSQVKLPFRRAVRIAVQGIRIRLGRSLVTLSGVVLGIAFLMNTLTTELVNRAVTKERELRQSIALMETVVRAEAGALEGKVVAIAVQGELSRVEQGLVERIVAARPAEVRASGVTLSGVKSVQPQSLGKDAAIVLVLGAESACPASLAELTAGMATPVVLDSLAARTYAGGENQTVRRELFFGKRMEQEAERLRQEAVRQRFQTIWIVVISLGVTVIGVANALLMSVTERFREIGTMKCLGALSGFIRTLFLIESSLIGFAGSVIGAILGALLTMLVYGVTYSFGLVFGSMPYALLMLATAAAIVAGTLLAVIAALYPARFASRMVPASALRSTV